MCGRSSHDDTGEKRTTCGRILALCVWKTWLILVTLICVLLGLAVGVGSIWVMADESFAEGVQEDEKLQGIRTGAGVLLGASFVIIAINGLGLFGAFLRKEKLLLAFAILVFLVLIAPEFALIIWFLSSRDQVVGLIDEVLKRNLGNFVRDGEESARIFMSNMQMTLHCCGVSGIEDYQTKEQRKTCYSVEEGSYHIYGCKKNMESMFMENIIFIAVAEIIHLLITILGIVAAIKLRNEILSKQGKEGGCSCLRTVNTDADQSQGVGLYDYDVTLEEEEEEGEEDDQVPPLMGRPKKPKDNNPRKGAELILQTI